LTAGLSYFIEELAKKVGKLAWLTTALSYIMMELAWLTAELSYFMGELAREFREHAWVSPKLAEVMTELAGEVILFGFINIWQEGLKCHKNQGIRQGSISTIL